MKERIILFLFWLLSVCQKDAISQNQLSGSIKRLEDLCDLGRSCTSDPTYKYFEKEQLKAYCATPAGKDLLKRLLDTSYMNKVLRQVDSSIRKRPNSLGDTDDPIDENVQRVLATTNYQKLPTCYENPQVYYLINDFVRSVERARKQLKLPLKIIPKYGSLPTPEINAYTYPPVNDKEAVEKRGSIIGFNTQLFMFAYQMPKITFPTIEIGLDSITQKVQIDCSRETAIRLIEENPDLAINFNMAILEFLQLVEPSTEPLDGKYDAVLITLTMATELFAVAHEYGHLIKGHTFQGTKSLRLNFASEIKPVETMVGFRSWQQELEADEIGIKLLIQVLKNDIADAEDSLLRRATQMRHIYSLYGPLFYFRCNEIIERAKYVRDNNTVQPARSNEETAYVRALVNNKGASQQNGKFPQIKLTSHPPAWLRYERVAKIIQAYLKKETLSEETLEHAAIGKGLVENIEILWSYSLPRLPILLDVIQNKKVPDSIGYIISPGLWDRTFLFNPDLNDAISIFYERESVDSAIVKKYWQAVKTDWLLLSGLQIHWAEKMLTSDKSNKRKQALAVIALCGNKQSVSFLQQLPSSSWDMDDRQILKKAIGFLEKNGRLTAVDALLDLPPEQFTLTQLLSYPARQDSSPAIDNLIPKEVPLAILEYLRSNRAVIQGRSLSSMALYMLVAKTAPDISYGFWADLLLRSKHFNSALHYAETGLALTGPNASLENTIGNVLSGKGDFRGAIPHYENSLKLGRIDGWPEINMAKNYVELGDLVQAEQWFRKGIKRDKTARSVSEYAGYLNEFAWFLVTSFKADTAKVKEALAYSYLSNKILQYSDPNYLDTFAECLAANGEFQLALETAQAALKLVEKDSPDRSKYETRLEEFKAKLNSK